VATTAVQYGEFVYAVFKPKMTLTSGMETSFLCRLQLPSSQTCDFTSPSQKINQGKTLILDRLANIDRQLRLVSFSQIDQSTVFLGHYKKGDRQGQLAWLQLKNSTLNNIGYYKANPYSQIIASNDTILYDNELSANPRPKCSMKSTGAAKYDCIQCSRSDNPFCSGYDGNTCSSKGEHNCAKIPIYRNTYTVPRTVLILDMKALLLKVKLTIDQSKFVDIINTELTANWSMKKGEYGNVGTPYYELNQSLSPTHNICNDEQSVYLTTWSTVNDPVLVSEEQFKIKNECQDLREESILLPPPPTPPSIRTTRRLSVSETTPNLPTVSIFVSENGTSLSDALSTGSIETTMAPSQVVQLAEASILGKSVLVISVLVVGILIGFTLGCCVGSKRKKYSMGKHARAP